MDLEKAFDRVPREVTWWAMRKLGVEEWLVKVVMAMYEGARTRVRTDDGDSMSFEVKVGLHQGSGLSPLLFKIVMEAISEAIKGGLPWELLYADDIVLVADSLESLLKKLGRWKHALQAKGLKVNVDKTKIMMEGLEGFVQKSGKFPCAVCGKGVGDGSVKCEVCNKWVHGRCSGLKRGMLAKTKEFKCKICTGKLAQKHEVVVGFGKLRENAKFVQDEDGAMLEVVGSYCYLGDVQQVDGGVDAAVVARIRCAWGKFRELEVFLTMKGVSLKLMGEVYHNCVRCCMQVRLGQ